MPLGRGRRKVKTYLLDGVKEKLEKLKLDYKLYLITSRPTRDIEFTRDYIDNIFGENYFEDIVFTCEHNDDKKCELSKKYKFDIVIDDAPHHIENYLNNTDIKKIIIFDQPWNRFISEDSKRLFRVKSWSDINFKIKYD